MEQAEFAGARSLPGLAVAALLVAAFALAIPATSAPPSRAPEAPTTLPADGPDAGDALASLFAGVAAGALLFSYGDGRARRAAWGERKAHLP